MRKKVISCLIAGILVFNFYKAQNSPQIVVDNQRFSDLNKDGKLQPYEDTRLSNYERINDLVPRLSLDDKIHLLLGTGMVGFEMLKGFEAIDPKGVTIPSYLIPGSAGSTTPIEKWGIPAVIFTDGPAGVRISAKRKGETRTYYATGFPVGALISTTWDVELAEEIGKAIGDEALRYGSDIQLAPALNIIRNPLCGRNFEYFSEDPLIAGKMASAITQGIQKNGVGVSLKHFAANNSENNRMDLNVHLSQRALREIYLRGFEIAVKESNPATIMSSYNKINGTYTSASYDLLTTILRKEWGFKGSVITDWFGGYSNVSAVSDTSHNGISKDSYDENIFAKQINAGNNLLMPGTQVQFELLKKYVETQQLSIEDVNNSVKKVLEIIFNSPREEGYIATNDPDLKSHALLSRKVASEGMILLKNDKAALPLANDSKIALFGSGSYNIISGGTGSGNVNKAYEITLSEGLENAGYSIDKNLDKIYSPFVKEELKKIEDLKKKLLSILPTLTQPIVRENVIKNSAKNNSIAIITIGREAGESGDRKIKDDFDLSEKEKNLISEVSKAFHEINKRVIVVINSGSAIETSSWKDKVDAILWASLPGQEGGNAITDVLSGKVNPSGKLTQTLPVKYSDVPSAPNFDGVPAEKPINVSYKEGIYVGYRYFNTFNVSPSYEFGYGLSYTTFDYSEPVLSSLEFNQKLYLSLKVKNTGNVAGKEVVQLYLSTPKGDVDKPVKELKGFVKTKLLKPGESQNVYFELQPKDLASFNPLASAWIADAGVYKVELSSSSINAKRITSFTLPEKLVVEKVNNVLNNDLNFQDLSSNR
ncbi:beta-glucosidase [Apibacter adventoris]|uniref:beta-glucosidase n=1 Tax=Apibacter adventoris TaxID=1679466 RepID=UPI000CF5E0D3|nr:glycoside hydrolase family 3 C-terminal domain-containing protein [Apibacter adventoris]PQL92019.1 glycosyl hydrolase [Apibacter adventoris]